MLWSENTIKAQCVVSATRPYFSNHCTIMRKNTDSRCYKENIKSNHAMRYIRVIEVREGTYLYQGGIKGSSYGRGFKM